MTSTEAIPSAAPTNEQAVRQQLELQEERAQSQSEAHARAQREARDALGQAERILLSEQRSRREQTRDHEDPTVTEAASGGFQDGFARGIRSGSVPNVLAAPSGADSLSGEGSPVLDAGEAIADAATVVAENHVRFPELADMEMATGAAAKFPELAVSAPAVALPADVAESFTR